ncbi:MAG TPA: hypothetical protein VFE62_15005 [Gemmataceae bacterium]|nr:hypothetical protein [Gemmataceae bacterium]
MYGSVFFVLSALELISSSSVNPQLSKDGKTRPGAGDQADLSGYYVCKGQEAGGKNYSGIVVLTKKNEVYLIQWVVGGGANFSGIAIRQGDNLAGSWSINSERGVIRGVNLYRVESTSSGPRLVGRWSSVPGPGVQQNETLTFLKKLDTEDD